MTYQDEVLAQLKQQTGLLAMLVQNTAPTSPNYWRPLSAYRGFDWSSIGARIVESDLDGAKIVEWSKHWWSRRRSKEDDDYGAGIWFSRSDSTVEKKIYHKLITFRDRKIKKIGEDLADALAPPPAQAQPAPAPPIKPLDVQATAPAKPRQAQGKTRNNNHDLVQQAQAVQDAPSFYKFANAILKTRKDGHQLVSQVVNDPGSNWREKAMMALAGA